MTATDYGHATAFLRRAGLIAGILAIIAGIFGMHIMTGNHTMPASATSPGTATPHVIQFSASGHTGHAPDRTAPEIPGAQSTTSMPGPSCADTGACTTMSAMDAVCTPSPGNTPLAAPLPGSTPFAAHDVADASAPAATYAYFPGSPSPGQLCISRT